MYYVLSNYETHAIMIIRGRGGEPEYLYCVGRKVLFLNIGKNEQVTPGKKG